MSDGDATTYLAGGVSQHLEASTWRWTRERAVLRVPVASSRPRLLQVEYAVPGPVLKPAGTVTVTFSVNGRELGQTRHAVEGNQTFTQAVPAGWLQPGTRNELALTVQPPLVLPDGQRLGVVLIAAGFRRP